MSNTTEKPEILVNVYGTDAPDAAKFSIGAVTLDDVKRATDARRDLVNEQSGATRDVRRDR